MSKVKVCKCGKGVVVTTEGECEVCHNELFKDKSGK